jgi:hypothetical protein
MRKFLIPTKDATIYQAFPSNNSGFDEILEIGKVVDTTLVEPNYTGSSARSLLYFNLPTTASVSTGSKYLLNLKLANASNVLRNQTLVVYQISQSWDEGSGFFYENVKNSNDGATWNQLGSYTSWSRAGGTFLTASVSASTSLNTYPLEDIRIDVTSILQPIVNANSASYGLAIQFPAADEADINNMGNIKVFSAQTHTVHQPTLEIAWDNQTFITGSLVAIPALNVKITPTNIKEIYTQGDIARIDLNVRDEYPLKSFDSTLRYKNKYYLPSSSYYSVVDVQSNITVIPFDSYSKIHCDGTSSYVVLDTSPLYKGRFYTLRFKSDWNGYSRTIGNGTIFKIDL